MAWPAPGAGHLTAPAPCAWGLVFQRRVLSGPAGPWEARISSERGCNSQECDIGLGAAAPKGFLFREQTLH